MGEYKQICSESRSQKPWRLTQLNTEKIVEKMFVFPKKVLAMLTVFLVDILHIAELLLIWCLQCQQEDKTEEVRKRRR